MIKLNEQELEALALIAQEILDCTAGQFGYISDIKTDKFTKHQLAGYASQLSQKNLISNDEEFESVTLRDAGLAKLQEAGLFTDKNFDTF